MYKIKLRGDTKARWESANPVLALREVGLETDTKKLKIGDGISVYSALMYAGGNIQSLVEGEGITIDYTDPANPIISSTGGGGGVVYDVYDDVFIETTILPFRADDARILRGVRDANAGSILDTMFSDNLDPITEWYDTNTTKGALFGGHPNFSDILSYYNITAPTVIDPNRCYFIDVAGCGLNTFDVSPKTGLLGLEKLISLLCGSNQLTILDLTSTGIININCNQNSLTTLLIPNTVESLDCDNNLLTIIDFASLDNLTRVSCSSNNLASIAGIHGSISLLNCSQNNLTSVSFTLNSLTDFNCSMNSITSIDLTHNPSLRTLDCSYNHLTTLSPVSNSLLYLYCNNNNISSLDLSSVGNLFFLNCSHNFLSTINVSPTYSLNHLDCSYNLLNQLNVSGLQYLSELICSYNAITTITATGAGRIGALDCSHNSITDISSVISNLSGAYVYSLNCDYNQLTSLNVSSFVPNISYPYRRIGLSCSHNQLTNIVISNMIQGVNCSYNNLTAINFNYLSHASDYTSSMLSTLDCSHNNISSITLSSTVQNLNASYNVLTSLSLYSPMYWTMSSVDLHYNHLASINTQGIVTYATSYNFTYNYLPTNEVNRLLGLGYNSYYVTPQQVP